MVKINHTTCCLTLPLEVASPQQTPEFHSSQLLTDSASAVVVQVGRQIPVLSSAQSPLKTFVRKCKCLCADGNDPVKRKQVVVPGKLEFVSNSHSIVSCRSAQYIKHILIFLAMMLF